MRQPRPWGLSLRLGQDGLDDTYRLRDAAGRVLGAVALGVTLYIEHGDAPQVREGMLRAYEACVRWAGKPFVWGMDPASGAPVEVASGAVDVRKWPAAVLRRFDFQMMFTGAASIDDADPYTFVVVSREREDDELSWLSLSLPIEWAWRHPPDDFVALVQELCTLVGPRHGYAGPYVLGHPAGNEDDATAAVYGLARLYRGLELDVPPQHAPYLAREGRIKGINWLTVLSASLEQELGGADALLARLTPFVQRTPFHGAPSGAAGGILRIGDTPLAGADAEPMYGYQRVARELLPVRDTNPALIWPQGAPGFDFDESVAWMKRFD